MFTLCSVFNQQIIKGKPTLNVFFYDMMSLMVVVDGMVWCHFSVTALEEIEQTDQAR